MKLTTRFLFAVALFALAGCAHVAETRTVFMWRSDPLQPGVNGSLILRITRHLDTLFNAPDIEEDQHLTLEVRGWQMRQRLPIPSDQVVPHFKAERFGPTSIGQEYRGYLLIQSATPDKVRATLHLVVTARTRDGRYVQTEKFQGTFDFIKAQLSFDARL
jgi:hypothetical protein